METFKLNDTAEFQQFRGGTQDYYKYFGNLVITDGVKYLADTFNCYWFIDLVAIYSKQLAKEEFQIWILRKENEKFFVTVEDGNDNVIKRIPIPYSDFTAEEVHVWLENNVIYLPVER